MGKRQLISRLFLITSFLFLYALGLYSQGLYVPLAKDIYSDLQRQEVKQGLIDSIHLSQLPVRDVCFLQYAINDTQLFKKQISDYFYYLGSPEDGRSVRQKWKNVYRKKVDFYTYQKNKSLVRVNPVIHFGYFSEEDMPNMNFINSRGIEIQGHVDKKIGFYTYITDNQIRAPFYVGQQIIRQSGSFPGGPWVKTFKEDQEILLQHDTIGTVDFFNARAYINWNFSEHIAFQFGHDRHFIGNGLRSLVLSDNAYNTFFLKMKTQLGRFSYQNLFMELSNWPELRLNNLIQKKYAAIHHLSVNLGSKFNLGLFESIFYARGDTSEYPSMELQYLNPLIFYRSVEHGLGSPDNANLGFDFKYAPLKKVQIYGQFVLDDLDFQYLKMDFDSLMVKYGLKNTRSYDKYQFWLNKWAVQCGIKYVDAFGLENLDFQLEYNRVRPFTYAHGDQRQNVSHYRQALAHPLGSNFAEKILKINYKLGEKWRFQYEQFGAFYGLDSLGSNYGQDIHKNPYFPGLDQYADGYFDVKVGQGIMTNWALRRFTLSYEWKPQYILEAVVMHRKTESELEIHSSNKWYFGLAFRCNALPIRHNY